MHCIRNAAYLRVPGVRIPPSPHNILKLLYCSTLHISYFKLVPISFHDGYQFSGIISKLRGERWQFQEFQPIP